MTQKQRIFRLKLLKRIHTHQFYKNATKLEAWEGFLYSNFKINSSKYLSINELITTLKLMNQEDVVVKIDYDSRSKELSLATKKQIKKLFSLKKDLNFTTEEFKSFILKYSGKNIDEEMIRILSKKEISRLITVLIKIKEYKKG